MTTPTSSSAPKLAAPAHVGILDIENTITAAGDFVAAIRKGNADGFQITDVSIIITDTELMAKLAAVLTHAGNLGPEARDLDMGEVFQLVGFIPPILAKMVA